MTHRVIYVGGEPCEFCQAVMRFFPGLWSPTQLTLGRAYTVLTATREQFPLNLDIHTIAYRLVEAPLKSDWLHCSCEFSEIEGDGEAWRELMRENRPITRVLEPA